jgi:hypothetical protein
MLLVIRVSLQVFGIVASLVINTALEVNFLGACNNKAVVMFFFLFFFVMNTSNLIQDPSNGSKIQPFAS